MLRNNSLARVAPRSAFGVYDPRPSHHSRWGLHFAAYWVSSGPLCWRAWLANYPELVFHWLQTLVACLALALLYYLILGGPRGTYMVRCYYETQSEFSIRHMSWPSTANPRLCELKLEANIYGRKGVLGIRFRASILGRTA